MNTLHTKLLDSMAYLSTGKYAIAVSGGSDSLAMLYIASQAGLKNCVVVHFDHDLRVESADEALFVKTTAESLGFKYKSIKWAENNNTNGNFYQSARNARYKFFAKVISEYNLDGALIAHSKTDLAETLLMRLGKGCSLKGASFFKQGNAIFGVKLYRPLLDFSREDLKQYLTDLNITWMVDPSNIDQKKMRPRLRANLALFEKLGISLNGLKSAVKYFSQADDAIEYYTKKELLNFNESDLNYSNINNNVFFNMPVEVQIRLVNYFIKKHNPNVMHLPRRKKLLELLTRLRENNTSVEIIDTLQIETVNAKLFFFNKEFKKTDLSSQDNSVKLIYLQDISKKTRYNIVKHNNLQFLPINIRSRVIFEVPKNKSIKNLSTADFTCLIK